MLKMYISTNIQIAKINAIWCGLPKVKVTIYLDIFLEEYVVNIAKWKMYITLYCGVIT